MTDRGRRPARTTGLSRKQQLRFERRAEVIWQRSMARAHRHALDTIREFERLKREYQLAVFSKQRKSEP